MKTHARVLGIGALALASGIWFLAASGSSAADDKDVRAIVLKIADLIEKKDDAGASKEAKALKDKLDEAMALFALRTKKGLGVGPKAGAITPDGIEAKLINIAKKPMAKAQLEKEADALMKAAYASAALAEAALVNTPEKDMGMKKKKDWTEWSKEMRQASIDLAAAAKARNPDAVKTAAAKLNSSCNNCHGVFRD